VCSLCPWHQAASSSSSHCRRSALIPYVVEISFWCEIPGFRRDVGGICSPLGYYAGSSVNHLPTFRDSVSVPSSRAKKSKKKLSRKGIISWRCALSQKGAHLVLVFLKPCRTVFVVASQLPMKFSALFATQTFIAMFTLALRSQVKPFCPGSFGCNIIMLFSCIPIGALRPIFPSDFPTKTLYVRLPSVQCVQHSASVHPWFDRRDKVVGVI
jgi:hypothetical protein